MFSRNKIILLSGVFNFLNRNADLINHELRISHVVKRGTELHCKPETEVRLQLVKKSSFFKTEVWTLTWREGFKDYIELPDELCNPIVQGRLAREREEQAVVAEQQTCQPSLFHASGVA